MTCTLTELSYRIKDIHLCESHKREHALIVLHDCTLCEIGPKHLTLMF